MTTEVETIRSVLAAYAKGEIELPSPGRTAFKFAHGGKLGPYTTKTLSSFLGWNVS
jgi:hypothetical protein